MIDILKVAEDANVIVDGYAFTKCEEGYRVLNLNHPEKAALFLKDCSAAETTMDDIELQIVNDLLKRNAKFMEDDNAEIL